MAFLALSAAFRSFLALLESGLTGRIYLAIVYRVITN